MGDVLNLRLMAAWENWVIITLMILIFMIAADVIISGIRNSNSATTGE